MSMLPSTKFIQLEHRGQHHYLALFSGVDVDEFADLIAATFGFGNETATLVAALEDADG
eukprot:CAMPEP_0119514652 /NCGR_PEP_ID=MMETSP1344-20130328/32414_1 /TAXON_ID=236787 /ORGANISM="Florenciella parvula, Strain CCMP2471" /LENGTH=58 /DNA_ID=CAMNT_0007551989 /DNA_START=119 /DNA_END=291 /DNA_ORIENTATION=+